MAGLPAKHGSRSKFPRCRNFHAWWWSRTISPGFPQPRCASFGTVSPCDRRHPPTHALEQFVVDHNDKESLFPLAKRRVANFFSGHSSLSVSWNTPAGSPALVVSGGSDMWNMSKHDLKIINRDRFPCTFPILLSCASCGTKGGDDSLGNHAFLNISLWDSCDLVTGYHGITLW